ncbi:hypothetical protein LCGC14_3006120, partial [marine sediment metagenome]
MTQDWFQTYTGHAFPLFDFKPADFIIEDIAHSLANLCRYNGHTKFFYSVSQHSVYVYECLKKVLNIESKKLLLTGLLHDAAESICGDMISPVKHHPIMRPYVDWINHVERGLAEQFDISYPFPPIIKRADNIVLATEKEQITHQPPPRPWTLVEEPWHELEIEQWSPEVAKERFLAAFAALS